jgi:choline dehydrogenase
MTEQSDRTSGTAKETFDFIVIGSGAGGGPVAANLAKTGQRVLLLEAGGEANEPSSRFRYEVVGASARLDPDLGWSYWVNSRKNPEDRRQQHFYNDGKGLYYPRGTSLGGSTTVNAMIALYPDNKDWDDIAELTGDPTWSSEAMRPYFERLSNVRYCEPEPGNPARLGFSGWLPLEQLGIKPNLLKDPRLAAYVAERVSTEPGGAEFAASVAAGEDYRPDPNDWRAVQARMVGLVDPPRSAENGARRGTRELLLATARDYPKHLTIRTDSLVTRLLFDQEDSDRIIGVEYLEGRHLYGASLRAADHAADPGIRREAYVAREVILSAGAFNSPQILMLSGIGPAAELKRHGIEVKVAREGVGKNLQDRLETGVVVKLPFEPDIYAGCTWGADGDPCKVEFETGDPNGAYRSRLIRQMYIVRRSSPEQEVPNLVTFGFIGRFRGYYAPGTEPKRGKDEFTWFTLSGHTVNRGGEVTLRSADPRSQPEINFNNFEDGTDTEGRDLEALLAGVKAARRMAAGGRDGPAEGEISPGPACVDDDQLRQFIKNEAWGHHASCSNRMGLASDPLAVVDSRFRVHGTRGLRIVDASVFPRIPGLFIVVPIYMIAEKASDIILADIAGQNGEASYDQ